MRAVLAKRLVQPSTAPIVPTHTRFSELRTPIRARQGSQRYQSATMTTVSSPLKRKAGLATSPRAKKPKTKIVVPEYHLTPSRRDGEGEIVWPAPTAQIERARQVIRQWYVRDLFLVSAALQVSERTRASCSEPVSNRKPRPRCLY
jgi:hypothetical protein